MISIHKLLFTVMLFWSLLTWTVSAGLVSKFSNTFYGYRTSNDPANATLAWSLIAFFYFIAAIVLLVINRSMVLIDIVALSFLFIFGLGAVGSLSSQAGSYRAIGSYAGGLGSLGQAAIALGWILIFLILGTLIYELVVVIRNHGLNSTTLKSSFDDLEGGSGGGFQTRNATTQAVTV